MNVLQKQLADHWLKLNYPEEIKPKNVILEKIRGSGAKVAGEIVDLVGLR
jgi:hypothetical protein